MTVSADFGNSAGDLHGLIVLNNGLPYSWAGWYYLHADSTFYFLQVPRIDFTVSFFYDHASGKIKFQMTPAGITIEHAWTAIVGSWIHIATTVAADGSANIYVSGTLLFSGATGLTYAGPSNSDIVIGAIANGMAAHLAIWQSVLSGPDVAALAAGSNPINLSPWIYWPDLSGAGPHHPAIGVGDLVEYGTVTDGASDPPVNPYVPAASAEDDDMQLYLSESGQLLPVNWGTPGVTLSTLTITVYKPGNSGYGAVQTPHPTTDIGNGDYLWATDAADIDVVGNYRLKITDGATTKLSSFTVVARPATAEVGVYNGPNIPTAVSA